MIGRQAILAVDDEALFLLSLKQELRLAFGSQYLYETALSAEDALAAIESLVREDITIVVLITDWLMPGMRGDEFLRIVHGDFPSIKLVMLSGHADDREMAALARDTGLFAYLSKPYRRDSLIDIVRRALLESS